MTSEELKIKVSLETSRLKQEIRLLKQSFKELKIDSKNKRESDELANSLEKVEKTLKDIDNLNTGRKLANDLDKAKKKAKEVSQAVNEIGHGKGVSVSGGADMNADFAQMEETLSAIKNLSIAELFASLGDSSLHLRGSIGHLKTAFTELKDGVSLALSSLNPFSKLAKSNDIGKGLGDALAHAGEGADSFKMHIGNAKKEWAAFTSSIPKGVAAAAAAIAVLVTAIAAVKNAITQAQQASQIAFNAEKIGMTTQAYSEWGYVITQLGGEIDDLTDYVRTLSAAQNDVRSGAEDWVAAFEKLGMTQEEVANMSQSEMFARTITGLQNLESEVERVSLAYKIFGEDDGAKVTTLLHTNAEETARMIQNFHLLGGVMSNELTTNSKILTGSLNNMRVAWTGLRNTLAEVFLPIIIPVVQWLTKAIAVVNMFLRAIFGKDISPTSKSVDTVANSYTGYTNAAENASTATDNVTKSIEKLKRQTMGFDELNKLASDSYASSSNSGNTTPGVSQLPTGGTTGGLNLPTAEDLGLEGISEWIEKNKQPIQDITAILLTFGGVALAVLCFLHGNILGGIAGLGLAGIGIAIGSQEGGVWDRLVDGIKTAWGNVKSWFDTTVKPVFTKEWWSNLFDTVKEGASEKLEAVKTAISDKWEAIKEWFNTNIKPKFTKEYWLGIWNGIKDGAAEMWENFKDSDIMKFINSVKDKAVTLTATFKEKGAEIGTKIQNAWNTVKTKTAELTATFKEKGATIRANAYKAWGRVKTKTATLTAKFKQTGAYKAINNAWNKFKTKSSTLTVKFKDSFTAAIKKAWNGLVKAINKAIGTINKIPGVNISKLPELATGGITNGPTPAVIGEAGREAVLPLERNTGWMDTLADKIAARGGNNGSAPTKVVLSVDGKELGWATINNINSITRQTGGLQLQLV